MYGRLALAHIAQTAIILF